MSLKRVRAGDPRARKVNVPRVVVAVLVSAVLSSVLGACGSSSGGSASKSGPIKLGVLALLTGPASVFGPQDQNAAKLAAAQLNKSGGVLGRKVQLVFGDTGSDPNTALVSAQRLVTKEGVAALVAQTNSPNLRAVLPIAERAGIPLLHTTTYQGGQCSKNLYAIASVPETYKPVFAYMADLHSKGSWFFVGSDSPYSQAANKAAGEVISASGGTVAGEQAFPLGTTDFSQVLGKIQQAKPKTLFVSLYGGDLFAFLKQAASFGVTKSTTIVTTGLFDEQISSLGQAAAGVYGIEDWTPKLDRPQSQAFVKAYTAAYGARAPPIDAIGEGLYDGVMVWAKAAEKAGKVDGTPVLDAMAGLTYSDAPRGSITLQGKTHHVTMDIHLMRADAKGGFNLVKTFGPVDPGPQCNL